MVTITPSENRKDEYIISTNFGWNSELENYEKNKEKIAL